MHKEEVSVDSNKSIFETLRGIFTVPLAGLFLILLLVVFAKQDSNSKGETVLLMNYRYRPAQPCDPITLRLSGDGRIWFNWSEVPLNRIMTILNQEEAHSNDRTLYIAIDSNVKNEDALDFIDKVSNSSTDLNIVLLTPKNYQDSMNSSEQHPNGIGCDLDWSPRQLKEFEKQKAKSSVTNSLPQSR